MIFPIYLITTGFLIGQLSGAFHKEKLDQCIADQVNLYGDLCAESSSNYESMTGSDAHFDGVSCAVESTKYCMDAE